jgi:hypothetical protein
MAARYLMAPPLAPGARTLPPSFLFLRPAARFTPSTRTETPYTKMKPVLTMIFAF